MFHLSRSVAYQLIYNKYYRDQNLTEPIDISLLSGFEDTLHALNLLQLRRRAWEKDYFTSALPWLQRGPEVTVPIQGVGDTLDVKYDRDAETTQRWLDSDLRSFEQGVAYDAVFSMEGNPRLSRLIGVNGGTGSGAYRDWETDRKSTRLNSSHRSLSRMPSSA